jgi:hypothetical protein
MFFEGWISTQVNTWKMFGLRLKKVLNDVPIIGAGLGKEAMEKLDKDIKKAENLILESAKKTANGALQMASGIDKPLDKIIDMATDINKAVDEATIRARKMADLRVQIRQSEITLTRDLERNRRKMEEQKLILENQLLPMAERQKAGKEYMNLLDANIKREADIYKNKLKLAKLEMEANDTNDETKKAFYDMVAEKEAMMADATGKRIEVQNKLNDFIKQENVLRKEELKALNDLKAEALTEQAKREIEIKKASLEEDIKLAEFEMERQRLENEDFLSHKLHVNRNNAEEIKKIQREAEQQEYERQKKQIQDLFNLKVNLVKEESNRELEIKEVELKAKLDKDLSNEKNTLAMKRFLNEEYENNLANLRAEYLTNQNKTELELKREHEINLLNIENEHRAERRKQEEEDFNLLKEKEKARVELAINSAETIAKGLISNQNRRLNEETKREIEALNLRKQAGEISEEEFAKKRLEIDRRNFEKKKSLDTREALMNGAVAVMKTIAQMGFTAPLLPFALAGLGVTTGAQVASIQAQKFRFGGNVGGSPHSRGGTIIEADRGEAVIMREAVNPITAPILSAINTSYGGNPISALNDFKGSNNNSSGGTQQIEVINVATDTARINTRVKNLQTSKSF